MYHTESVLLTLSTWFFLSSSAPNITLLFQLLWKKKSSHTRAKSCSEDWIVVVRRPYPDFIVNECLCSFYYTGFIIHARHKKKKKQQPTKIMAATAKSNGIKRVLANQAATQQVSKHFSLVAFFWSYFNCCNVM